MRKGEVKILGQGQPTWKGWGSAESCVDSERMSCAWCDGHQGPLGGGSLPVHGLPTTVNPPASHGLMTDQPWEDGGWPFHSQGPRTSPVWLSHRVPGGKNVGSGAGSTAGAGVGRPCMLELEPLYDGEAGKGLSM